MRKKVGPELDFALLQILEQYSSNDRPLKISQLQKRCEESYGISVSKDVIRNRLDSLTEWISEFEAQEQRVLQPHMEVAIRKVAMGQSFGYYADTRRHVSDATEASPRSSRYEYALVSLDDWSFKEVSPQTGKALAKLFGMSEGSDLRLTENKSEIGMPYLSENLAVLQAAIDNNLPVDAKVEHWHIEGRNSGNGEEGPRTASIIAKIYQRRGNQKIQHQWPYALKYSEGYYYVIFNALNRAKKKSLEDFDSMPLNDDFRIVRVDRLRDIRLSDEKETDGASESKSRHRPKFNGTKRPTKKQLDRFLEGSIYGMGHSRGPQEVALRAKGKGLEFALETFHEFEGFSVAKEHGDVVLDERDAKERELKGKSNARHKDGDWYTLRFKAHPKGVALWATKYIDSIEVVEPAWARKIVVDAIRNNVYGVPAKGTAANKHAQTMKRLRNGALNIAIMS